MGRGKSFLLRDELLRYVAEAAPKVLLLEAPAGYGKSTVARQIAGETARTATVDALGADSLEFHRRLFEALVAGDATDPGPGHGADALGASTVVAWRAICTNLWTQSSDPHDLLFENMESVADQPEVLATLNELFARPNANRRVLLCTRQPLPIRIGRFAYPHEVLRLGIGELRFSPEELAMLFGLRSDDSQLASIVEVTRGWPIATLLLRRLRLRHPAMAELRGQDTTQLFGILADEVLALLAPDAWDVLLTIVALPDATIGDVIAALGPGAENAIRKLLSEAPFVDAYGDALQPHPLLRELVVTRHPHEVRQAGERAAQSHLSNGARLRAAKIFLALGDAPAALDAIHGLEAAAWLGTPSYELSAILASLDGPTLMTDPGIWAYATTYSRTLKISTREWLHEGLEVWARHNRTMRDDVAVSVVANIINASMNNGLLDDCERWLEVMRERAPDSIVYRLWSTAIDAMRARPLDVHTLERDVVGPLGVGYPQAIYLYDVIARIHRLRGERDAERAVSARAVDIALATRLPLAIALTSTDAAFGAWLAGEEALYQDYVEIARRNFEAAPDAGQRHFIECLDGNGLMAQEGTGKLKTRAYAYLIAAGRSGVERSQLLERALAAADMSSQPYARIIVRVAIAAADPARAADVLAEARAIAKPIDSPRLREALDDLQRGAETPMLAALCRRFRRQGSDVSFDIITGQLTVNGQLLPLTERQTELLTLLASRRRSVHRDEIIAAMWPEHEREAAQGALRTMVSRLRSVHGLRDVLITVSDGYALAGNAIGTVHRLRSFVERLESTPANAERERVEVAHALDAILARDRSRATRWEWFADMERELDVLEDRASLVLARTTD